jgi:hypothetical protein
MLSCNPSSMSTIIGYIIMKNCSQLFVFCLSNLCCRCQMKRRHNILPRYVTPCTVGKVCIFWIFCILHIMQTFLPSIIPWYDSCYRRSLFIPTFMSYMSWIIGSKLVRQLGLFIIYTIVKYVYINLSSYVSHFSSVSYPYVI